MEVRASAKYIRMSARKVRLVVDVIRGLSVNQALDQLKFVNKRAVKPVIKLLNSAAANAKHNYEIEQDNLFIKEIKVNEGAALHRWQPRAYGRATPIRKRTCHIDLVVGEIKAGGRTTAKKQAISAPVKLDSRVAKSLAKAAGGQGIKVESRDKGSSSAASGKNIPVGNIGPEKDIIDQRREGRGKHAKIEGQGGKGLIGKVFRRKSG